MSEVDEQDEDLVLVDRILDAPEGDTRAFEELVQRHTRTVVANCRYITRSPSDAEDLAQDVFVKVYFSLRRFERRSKFRTWLRRVKANHCLSHLKRSEGRSFVELDDVDAASSEALRTDSGVEARFESEAARERISGVLDEMKDNLRVPLILRDMDEMSYQEIAELLGLGLSAVKMRIKRAREEFRERYRAAQQGGAAEKRVMDFEEDDGPGGEPVAELRGLAVEPSAGFKIRLRRRIERREVSNQVFWFSWHLPAAVFLAFLEMVFALFGSNPSDGGGVK